jgi:serine/threonine-protein phosphatase PGAM5
VDKVQRQVPVFKKTFGERPSMNWTRTGTKWHLGRWPLLAVLILVTIGRPVGAAGEGDQEGKGVRTIYLVRHGDYDWQDERDPDVGKALIPLGVAQARLVAARLSALPLDRITLYSSTMTRARQTAQVMARDFPGLAVNQIRLLRECTPPTWRQDIMEREDPVDLKRCVEQLEQAYQKFFIPSPDRNRIDILVCHGNVIRYLVTRALQVETMAWLGMAVTNCGLTEVRIYPSGRIKLVSYNDTGHIPPNLKTEAGMDTGPVHLKVLAR